MVLFAYFPARRTQFHCNWSELKCRNLGDLLDGAVDPERDEKFVVPVDNGPDGNSGGVAAIGADPIECDLEAAVFDHRKCEWYQTGANWIGWLKDKKPGPADLARSTLHPGVDTTLGDDNRWRVPLTGFLPRLLHRNDKGDVVAEEVTAPYRVLHELSHELRRHILSQSDEVAAAATAGKLYLPGSETLVEGLLRLNYRCAPDLFLKLGLWRPDCLANAVLSTTGLRSAADFEYQRRREQREFTSDN